MNTIKQAMIFTKACLRDKRRKDGELLVDHIQRIYKLLKYNKINNMETILTAILHHCVDEDIQENKEFIRHNYGDEILDLILNYQKIRKTEFDYQTSVYLNEKYIYQTFINLAGDLRLVIVRVVDKYDNLVNSWTLNIEDRKSAATKALYLYAPLAKMVGLGKLSSQIEDTAFRILNPRQYFEINKIRRQKIKKSYLVLREIVSFISDILREKNINNTISIRYKHVYSIYRKKLLYEIESGKLDDEFDKVTDIVGMRIIIDDIESCYELESLLDGLWDQIPESRDDNLIIPRKSGYKSLHLHYRINSDLDLEIQIRTYSMHEFNEYGPASHLLYKVGNSQSGSVKEEFSKYLRENPNWFRNMNFWDTQVRIQKYKPIVPFSKYVYVFTPKGDIIQLPRGAKVLDFAYSIHTELANYCKGCNVNNKISKLDYELGDGDLINILTSNKRMVNRDWISMSFMNKTKSKIKKSLNEY